MTLEQLIQQARFTILLGKNGAGKSTLLRGLDGNSNIKSKYITPERGGTLRYEPNIDQNISNSADWLTNDRRKNRTENFRQQSAVQFRNLEVLILREIESDAAKRDDHTYNFGTTLDKINKLLPAIELKRAERGFKIFKKNGTEIPEGDISSGESELISLAIEVLTYSREAHSEKLLLLDEPDVHLHPDLQERFVRFIEETATTAATAMKVVIATHSTAIIGGFSRSADLQIAPVVVRDQQDLQPFKYSDIGQGILPIFGAHPLSSHFNKSPPLLVEGEDDRRVLDQVVRSSNGKYVFSPCVVGTINDMNTWEQWLNTFLPSIYDSPRGYSLRDLDQANSADIDDLGVVVRARLNCYAIENILLTDESLASANHTPETFLAVLQNWMNLQPEHPASTEVRALTASYEGRRTRKIKDVRNLIVGLLGITKPWEVHVGQLLAGNFDRISDSPNSIRRYLGPAVLTKIFPA